MNSEVGLWIDHRKAIIVTVTAQGEETRQIKSNVEKHIRYAGGSRDGSQEAEDMRDRGFANHLSHYYADIVACIRDADSIQIFGPGEAKGELRKQLENKGLGWRVVGVETVDKMTDRQIAAKVRERFQEHPRSD
jgi:hypothetical protein